MLKLGKHSTSIFNAMAEKTREAFAGQLKTKTHKVSIGFNAPEKENVGTSITAKIHLCGSVYNEVKTVMNQYVGTLDVDKLREDADLHGQKVVTFQLSINVKNPAAQADALEKAIQEWLNNEKENP